jgi:hypothetical protein
MHLVEFVTRLRKQTTHSSSPRSGYSLIEIFVLIIYAYTHKYEYVIKI